MPSIAGCRARSRRSAPTASAAARAAKASAIIFEVDARYIVVATLGALARAGQIDASVVGGAIKTFGINPDKIESGGGVVATDLTLPELGENIAGGDVLNVMVKVGDTIAKDQTVLELETDKATIEVPSSVAGKITEIKVKAGDKVKVGQAILSVEAGDAAAQKSAGAAEPQKSAEGAAPQKPKPQAMAPAAEPDEPAAEDLPAPKAAAARPAEKRTLRRPPQLRPAERGPRPRRTTRSSTLRAAPGPAAGHAGRRV